MLFKSIPDRTIIFLALGIHLLAAWFSRGWQHPDEHYQLVEFAGYLAGNVPADGLAWEFNAQMRPSFQVFIAFGILEFFGNAGINDPNHLSFLLRLITGLICITSALLWHRKQIFETDSWKKLHLFLSLLGWALVYTHVRFSSETWSGLFLVLGMTALTGFTTYRSWLLSGFIFGLAFITRFQSGFFIAGLGGAILVFEPSRWKKLGFLTLGFFPALALGTGMDYLLYGKWVFTPWNYLDQNIFKNVAAGFGVEPWYWYILQSFEKLIPPFSLVVLAGFVLLVTVSRYRLLAWACFVFFLGHSGVGHKEWRFLFPLSFFVPIGCVLVWSALTKRFGSGKSGIWIRATGRFFVGLNSIILVLVCFRPAVELAAVYPTLSRVSSPAYLLFEKSDPYCSGNNLAWFYCNPAFRRMPIGSLSFVQGLRDKREIFFFTESENGSHFAEGSGAILVYSSFPEWIRYLNFNGWVDRTSWYRIYRLPDER